jgi:hypothetical protein
LDCETFVGSMQNLKRQGNLNGTKRLRCSKPTFIEKNSFMKVDMKGNAFLIYVFPSPNVEPHPHEIPSQYQEFKDVFQKKNVNTLPKYRPYNCN